MIPSSSSSRGANPSVSNSSRSQSIPRIDDSGVGVGGGGVGEIRPRNRRLVTTGEQELVSTSATSTPSGSRAVSPIPQKHPSRRVERENVYGGVSGRPVGGLLAPPRETGRSSSPISTGVSGNWWGTLQEIANTVLGVEVVEEEGTRDGERAGLGKKQSKPGYGFGLTRKSDTWGPETALPRKNDGEIGKGSTSEREAKLMQRKTARVLEGRDEVKQTLDTNGNYKRRTSTEEVRSGSSQEDDYALVYIHHVQPHDTLAGVVLKYNCQSHAFRKANGFWPNDSIQNRKTVVLPVDACAIKGRPCEPPPPNSPQGVDLLAPTPGIEDPPFSTGSTFPRTSSLQNGTSAERPQETENPWVHVRWVLIDSSPNSKPIEIARMPRKTLGYFPPRRRKSQNTLSTVSTPRGSTEFPQISQSFSQVSNDPSSSAASTPSRRTSNLGPRPSQPMNAIGSYFPPLKPGTRPRRESVSEAAGRLGWFSGPGGVGTFEKNVRKPGPAQDGLNSWARKHMPGLAIDSLPSTSILGAETAHFGFNEDLASIAEGPSNSGKAVSGTSTPRGSQGLGLEHAASALEGWVRKLTTKVPGTPRIGGRIEPDLIELLDGAGSDDGRAFDLNPGLARSSTPSGTGREDLDGMVRGRAFAGAKGGKND